MGSVLYITTNAFITEYLKNNRDTIDMNSTDIIIVSRETIASQARHESHGSQFYSRYKNVDFAVELAPSPKVEECYSSNNMPNYIKAYREYLTDTITCQKSLCAIVDLVVNDNFDVIILCSIMEWKYEYLAIMRDYMRDMFGVTGYLYPELVENPSIDIHNIGDSDDIRRKLQFQIENLSLVDKNIGVFLNKYKDDMEETYRKILMTKTVDELCRLGEDRGLYVNRYKTKEAIVDRLLRRLLE